MAGFDFLMGGTSDQDQALRTGLLAAGLGMLQNSYTPGGMAAPALGAGGLAGLQAYQGAVNQQADARMQNFRLQQIQQEAAQRQARQDAISQIQQRAAQDPNYQPTAVDLLNIDPEAAIKGLVAKNSPTEFGLVPQVGRNPNTGQLGYFVQDKGGNTRWLDAGAPGKFSYQPGTEYAPGTVFDPRTGTVSAPNVGAAPGATPGGAGTSAPMPGAYGAPAERAPAPEAPDPNAPWKDIVSAKERDQVRSRVYEQDNKRLDELRAQIKQGRKTMSDLDRFGQLNRQEATGGITDRFGFVPTMDADKREMEAITARLAPSQREPGSGTSSDRDVSLYLQGLPGIDKEGPVNKAIRDQYKLSLDNAEKEFAFKEKYLTKHGHLVGSDAAYRAQQTGGTKPQQPAPNAVMPPAAAINMLKRNPNLASMFDAKYGAGSAAQHLGR